MPLNIYNGRIPVNVDKRPILIGNQRIYRTSGKYEFDKKIFIGRGLLLNETEEDQFQ